MEASPAVGTDNLPLRTRPRRRSQCPAAGSCAPLPPSRTPCGILKRVLRTRAQVACPNTFIMSEHIEQQRHRARGAKRVGDSGDTLRAMRAVQQLGNGP